MATPRHTLMRYRFRQRFGVGARRVAVRAELPVYARALLWILITGGALALAVWMYQVGQRFAGFDQGALERELLVLRERVGAAEASEQDLRAMVSASTSQIQLEIATRDRLTAQLNVLQQENTVLKQDLAFFESLATNSIGETGAPSITRATVSADGHGKLRYRLLVSNPASGRKGEVLDANLQFELRIERGGVGATMLLPESAVAGSKAITVQVKRFLRMEGLLDFPQDARLLGGEIRLLKNGQVLARQPVVLEI